MFYLIIIVLLLVVSYMVLFMPERSMPVLLKIQKNLKLIALKLYPKIKRLNILLKQYFSYCISFFRTRSSWIRNCFIPFVCRYINSVKNRVSEKTEKYEQIPQVQEVQELDLEDLNSRIVISKQNVSDNSDKTLQIEADILNVEICGKIHAPGDFHKADLIISALDITEGAKKTKPVNATFKKWQLNDSSEFCYESELGKLPSKETVLSEWTSIAQLRTDWLSFPRRGRRILQFDISIISAQSKQEIAFSQCIFEYENSSFGYIDLKENIERAKTLTVALAFSVSASDGKLYDCEIDMIKNWARENLDKSHESENEKRKLERALNETVTFFSDGNKLNVYNICMEIHDIVPIGRRYDILDLCLKVAKAKGTVGSEELQMLKDIVNWIEVDNEKFRAMMDKTIPIDMIDVKDIETILGVTSQMSNEKAKAHLNREYAKWNSRVTNSDPKIQSQADQMLKLIAEVRSQYVEN